MPLPRRTGAAGGEGGLSQLSRGSPAYALRYLVCNSSASRAANAATVLVTAMPSRSPPCPSLCIRIWILRCRAGSRKHGCSGAVEDKRSAMDGQAGRFAPRRAARRPSVQTTHRHSGQRLQGSKRQWTSGVTSLRRQHSATTHGRTSSSSPPSRTRRHRHLSSSMSTSLSRPSLVRSSGAWPQATKTPFRRRSRRGQRARIALLPGSHRRRYPRPVVAAARCLLPQPHSFFYYYVAFAVSFQALCISTFVTPELLAASSASPSCRQHTADTNCPCGACKRSSGESTHKGKA